MMKIFSASLVKFPIHSEHIFKIYWTIHLHSMMCISNIEITEFCAVPLVLCLSPIYPHPNNATFIEWIQVFHTGGFFFLILQFLLFMYKKLTEIVISPIAELKECDVSCENRYSGLNTFQRGSRFRQSKVTFPASVPRAQLPFSSAGLIMRSTLKWEDLDHQIILVRKFILSMVQKDSKWDCMR